MWSVSQTTYSPASKSHERSLRTHSGEVLVAQWAHSTATLHVAGLHWVPSFLELDHDRVAAIAATIMEGLDVDLEPPVCGRGPKQWILHCRPKHARGLMPYL